MDLTALDIVSEYWAYHYLENSAQEEVEDDDFSLEEELAKIEQDAAGSDWEDVKFDDN